MASFHKRLRRRCFRLYRRSLITFGEKRALFVQPLTYMNRSGEIIGHFIPKHFQVENLVVICDNLDLEVGTIRIRQGGSSAGHNGLKSLIEALGASDFVRIYIGIGRPAPQEGVIEHVLGRPTSPEERHRLDEGIALAAKATIALCQGASVEELSREYNRKNGST